MFDEHELEHLKEHVAQYPKPRAGAIFCLYAVQDKIGYINDQGLAIVSQLTQLSPTQLEELITFFTLLRRRPVGRNVLRICDSISCHTMGSEKILQAAEHLSGSPLGQPSLDGAITILPSICLGLCNKAPAALLNDEEEIAQLTADKLATLFDQLRNESIDAAHQKTQLIATDNTSTNHTKGSL